MRSRKYKGDVIIAGPQSALELSESAAFLFRSIDGNRTVGEIGVMLADNYGIPVDVAVDDAREFLEGLITERIIEVRR